MTSEITEEMVYAARAAHFAKNEAPILRSDIRLILEAALAARPIETDAPKSAGPASSDGSERHCECRATSPSEAGSVVNDLREYARVGSGSKHHCQVQEKAADLIEAQAEQLHYANGTSEAQAAAIAERDERMKDLEDAILACEKGDALDVLANYRAVRRTIHATRAALQQEGE